MPIQKIIYYLKLRKVTAENQTLIHIYCWRIWEFCYKALSNISAIFILTSSTFWAVLAEASIKIRPCSLANCSPSSVLTALLWAKSHLLPISIIVMFAFACCLASSSQLAKWLKVSLLQIQNRNCHPSALYMAQNDTR